MSLLYAQDTYTSTPHDANYLPQLYVREALYIPRGYYQFVAARANCMHMYKSIAAIWHGR